MLNAKQSVNEVLLKVYEDARQLFIDDSLATEIEDVLNHYYKERSYFEGYEVIEVIDMISDLKTLDKQYYIDCLKDYIMKAFRY